MDRGQGENQVEMRRKAQQKERNAEFESSVKTQQHKMLRNCIPTTICTDKEAKRLSRHLQTSLSPDTLKKYATAWRGYCRWLSLKNQEGYNKFSRKWVHGVVIALYLSELLDESHDRGIGPNTLERTVAAIRYYYEMAGFSESPLAHPWCSRIVTTAKKLLVPKKLQRQSISVTDMKSLLSFHLLNQNADQIDLRTLMHLVTLLRCFLGFLRYNDAVSILVHEDLLRFVTDPSGHGYQGMLIFIPRSKTDQSWKGAWVAIGATGGALCPVFWTRTLLQRGRYVTSHTNPKVDCGPLLRAVTVAPRGNPDYPGYILAQSTSILEPIAGLTHSALLRSARVLLLEAGVDIKFGLHSLVFIPCEVVVQLLQV